MGYYLADGIYPDWPAFVKTIRHPYDVRTQHFATIQESARKDIERTFGVLQKRWAIVRGPAYGWSPHVLKINLFSKTTNNTSSSTTMSSPHSLA
jgi:hypothetical protein